ncbi:MAG: LTA synthase family protein [Eubacteriales bacterium]|nr:LTA synthase family protein [Eubacteriales bacterium]
MRKLFRRIAIVLTGLLVPAVSFLGFGARWGLTTWGELDMDEIVFQLQQPIKGTESSILTGYLVKGLLPPVLITVLYIVLQILLRKKKRRWIFTVCAFAASVTAAFFIKGYIWERLRLEEWLEGRRSWSTFVEENYTDPAEAELTFPEKKRNLIYIYLESMEVTYTDPASGGAFPENLIPELTRLAGENEDFSGAEKILNGGYATKGGTRFTTGAIFSQTTGLPLRIGIDLRNRGRKESYFPGVVSLGDILEKEGYRQVFLLGSDAGFGGRRPYFRDHGNYEIRDYLYAKEAGWIPEDYKVWWGYEDEKLFAFAKETLLELAQGEQPFNLTMLTVDTHFEGGYVCRLCGDTFGDDRYANVMACSSRQTAEFVAWVQAQDFYENTTIVVCGDHPTMSSYFCDDVAPDYLRKTYTAYIHSAVSPEDPAKTRLYTTFDDFPTTLASLGVTIRGERLGLGTNLFSGAETLSEQYGLAQMDEELSKRSAFLEGME